MNAVRMLSLSGREEEVECVPASEMKNAFRRVMDVVAAKGVVAVTRHARAQAVLIERSQFEALVRRAGDPLAKLTARFDGMLKRMQGQKAGAAMSRAFHAAPKQLGKAAVAQAAKATSAAQARRRHG